MDAPPNSKKRVTARVVFELELQEGVPVSDEDVARHLQAPFDSRVETLADDLDRDPTDPMPFLFRGASVSWS